MSVKEPNVARDVARKRLLDKWSDARRRLKLQRQSIERLTEKNINAWRSHASASDIDALDIQFNDMRQELDQRLDELLESIDIKHMPSFAETGETLAPEQPGSQAVSSVEHTIARLNELEAQCQIALDKMPGRLEELNAAATNVQDELARQNVIRTVGDGLDGMKAESLQLIEQIRSQRAELLEWIRQNDMPQS